MFQKMKKKNKAKDEEPDYSSLLVFGYGCKIFRDDERAVEENLIPWMGTDLTIDRLVGLPGASCLDVDICFLAGLMVGVTSTT